MTELLDKAIARIRALPSDAQDAFARILLDLAGEGEAPYELTPGEEASLEQARAEMARGEFASDEEVRAIWAKHGL